MKQATHQAALIFDNQDNHQGAVIRKPGSKKLYVLFYYFGRRVEKTTGLNDTPDNRKRVRLWLDRIIDKRDCGQLIFAEAFPGASDKDKETFAKLEGWAYTPEPKDVLFGTYVEEWLKTIWSNYPEGSKKDEYRLILERRLLPYFRDLTFYQISGVELQKFLSTLKWRTGKHKGEPLSKARVRNILIPLRTVWIDACDQYRWVLYNPFSNLKKHMPKAPAKRREGFRFDEWLAFLAEIDSWYKPVVELMLLTGMINSEVAGLRKTDIGRHHIQVTNTIVNGREQCAPKTRYRIRKITITSAIRQRLDILLERSTSDLLVTTRTGTVFHAANFRKNIWEQAQQASGITDKVPYSLRHSFAAWSLSIGIDMNRLVSLMGHGSKQMVYEVYGDYIDGLEEDREQILDYFGRDFLAPYRQTTVVGHLGESFGESHPKTKRNPVGFRCF